MHINDHADILKLVGAFLANTQEELKSGKTFADILISKTGELERATNACRLAKERLSFAETELKSLVTIAMVCEHTGQSESEILAFLLEKQQSEAKDIEHKMKFQAAPTVFSPN